MDKVENVIKCESTRRGTPISDRTGAFPNREQMPEKLDNGQLHAWRISGQPVILKDTHHLRGSTSRKNQSPGPNLRGGTIPVYGAAQVRTSRSNTTFGRGDRRVKKHQLAED